MPTKKNNEEVKNEEIKENKLETQEIDIQKLIADAVAKAISETNKEYEEKYNKLKNEYEDKINKLEDNKSNENKEDKIENNKKSNFLKIDLNRQVTIVHLEERYPNLFTYFKSANNEYFFSNFGQTYTVTYAEFQDIFARNKKLFENNIIALSSEDEDIANMPQYNLKEKKVLKKEQLEILPSLSINELESIYNNVCQSQKDVILEKWVRGYFEYANKVHNSNSAYADYQKIYLLNELSGQKMRNILDDIQNKQRRGIAI